MLARSSLRINALAIPQTGHRALGPRLNTALFHRSPTSLITVAQHIDNKKDDSDTRVEIQRGSTMQPADKRSFDLKDSSSSMSNTGNTTNIMNTMNNRSTSAMDPITQLAQMVNQVQPVLHQLQEGSKMLSTLLPRPMREAVEKNVQPLVNMTQMMIEPILSLLSQAQRAADTSQPLPQQASAAQDLGQNMREWDFNLELVNPVRGIELNEQDDKYDMNIKFADWVGKNDVHSRLVRLDNSEDGQFRLQVWGTVKRQMKSEGHRATRELSFRRAVTLPRGIDACNLKCEFTNDSCLHIELPKKEAAQKEQEVVGHDLEIKGPSLSAKKEKKLRGVKTTAGSLQFGSDGSTCQIHEGCETGASAHDAFEAKIAIPTEPVTAAYKPQYD